MMERKPWDRYDFLRVLALDPGETTGWAYGYIDTDQKILRFAVGQDKLSYTELGQFIIRYPADFYICEEVKTAGIKGEAYVVNPLPIELTGIIKYLVEDRNWLKGFYQGQDKQASFPTKRLQEMNCWTVSLEHARSATKHLLWWWIHGYGFQFNNGSNPELLGNEPDRTNFLNWCAILR